MWVIIAWIIGLFLFYLTIQKAIDGSETAENIREIRRILSNNSREDKINEKGEVVEEFLEVLDVTIDKCPACNSKVLLEDKVCPSCGLSLENIKI